jgi:hypothetical protein
LESEHFSQRTLIYSDNYHSFVSKVDFERSLEPLTISREHLGPRFQPFVPTLFIRSAGEGYSIGLVVDEWW